MHDPLPRPVADGSSSSDAELRRWLENMVWAHRYTTGDIRQATRLSTQEIESALERFGMASSPRPSRAGPGLRVLPYPGGRHPRTGFREGAVEPRRGTKISVFPPWDPDSYVVVDLPEAIWSNLGLIHLAHHHDACPTLWETQGQEPQGGEWSVREDGSLEYQRVLPNGIRFGAGVVVVDDVVRMELWLTNTTEQRLTDLRVQNCVLLGRAAGFESAVPDNLVGWGPYAACRDTTGRRWIITAWDPVWRIWNQPDCPCMHSDPRFPDCAPGATVRLRGRLSFHENIHLYTELLRMERSGWRDRPPEEGAVAVHGAILDADRGEPLPARVHVQRDDGAWFHVESVGGSAVPYDRRQPHLPHSEEVHTSLSADPFVARLSPGRYTFRIEHGKDYLPQTHTVTVNEEDTRLAFRLQRWIDLPARGWYGGDTHVHRSLAELPTCLLAEDLNVALPLTYWVADADVPPVHPNDPGLAAGSGPVHVDATHIIHPVNTEYEITQVGARRHVLGSMFVLNHRTPLSAAVPPVGPALDAARAQGALVDLDKHAWPWSLMLVLTGAADLYELANNHLWQTGFGLTRWDLVPPPGWFDIERNAEEMTEWGWAHYGFQMYYLLLSCGFRLRVSAGTASGVHPVPLGFGRVYVHLPDGFSYDGWIAGLNEGRSFVSTGPVLDLRFDGLPPGTRFDRVPGPTTGIRVTGSADSRRPLDRIEIIVNGRVHRRLDPDNTPRPGGGFSSPVDVQVGERGSYWLAVRCVEQHPLGRVRFAHTNPCFVDVAGRPFRPRPEEAEYLIQRMEAEWARNRDILPPEALREIEQALARARRIREDAHDPS